MSDSFLQNGEPYSLSVVVPNYNDSKYLKRCIDSVCSHDVPPNEFIILDDSSTDNSIEVIEKAIEGYSFVRLIQNNTNLGGRGVPNSNKGLSLAKSKYIYFLGANDLILPGFFSKVKEMYEANPNAGLFSAMVWLMDEEGKYLKIHSSPTLYFKDKFISPENCRQIMFNQGSWLTGQTTVYRREALIAAGGFDAKLGGLCDLLAAQVVASRYGANYSPNPLAVMRIHKGALLVDTLSDSIFLDAALEKVKNIGPLIEPNLFSNIMIQRIYLRFYFASVRLSMGETASYIQTKIGTVRSSLFLINYFIPRDFFILKNIIYFLILRPYDLLPALWFRGLKTTVVRIRELFLGRYPPKY